jgi:hypothetical protein
MKFGIFPETLLERGLFPFRPSIWSTHAKYLEQRAHFAIAVVKPPTVVDLPDI